MNFVNTYDIGMNSSVVSVSWFRLYLIHTDLMLALQLPCPRHRISEEIKSGYIQYKKIAEAHGASSTP